jgi:DUF218 domain
MTGHRLVAVLGYSNGRVEDGLHPVCAARLARAVEEARPGDTILLSGWRRWRRPVSEADLMAGAWTGRTEHLLLDRTSRTTYGNALAVAAAARALSASEVVLVTSGWHRRRAAALVRAAYGRRVSLAATTEHGTLAARTRELACWTLVPFQRALAGRRR